MELPLAILQGAGLAAAAGIRPFLPTLTAGALASADLGIDFDGTDYSFLEAPGFLLGVFALTVAFLLWERRRRDTAGDGRAAAALAGVAIGLGALLFAGSLADEDFLSWPGLLGGLACGALAHAAATSLLRRTGGRLDPEARRALPFYADAAALLLAGLAVLAPPVSAVALVLLAWLLVAGRRREGEKHAGLRVLR